MKNMVKLMLVGLLVSSLAVISSCASTAKSVKKQESQAKAESSKPVASEAATVKATPVPTAIVSKVKKVEPQIEKTTEKTPASSSATLEVLEIAIAKNIQEREAVEVGDTFPVGIERLYCWTKITGGAEGDSVTHRWKKGEEIMAETTLNVNGSPWRTYSSKAIMADWTGNWVVEILQGETVLASKEFVIQ